MRVQPQTGYLTECGTCGEVTEGTIPIYTKGERYDESQANCLVCGYLTLHAVIYYSK